SLEKGATTRSSSGSPVPGGNGQPNPSTPATAIKIVARMKPRTVSLPIVGVPGTCVLKGVRFQSIRHSRSHRIREDLGQVAHTSASWTKRTTESELIVKVS